MIYKNITGSKDEREREREREREGGGGGEWLVIEEIFFSVAGTIFQYLIICLCPCTRIDKESLCQNHSSKPPGTCFTKHFFNDE